MYLAGIFVSRHKKLTLIQTQTGADSQVTVTKPGQIGENQTKPAGDTTDTITSTVHSTQTKTVTLVEVPTSFGSADSGSGSGSGSGACNPVTVTATVTETVTAVCAAQHPLTNCKPTDFSQGSTETSAPVNHQAGDHDGDNQGDHAQSTTGTVAPLPVTTGLTTRIPPPGSHTHTPHTRTPTPSSSFVTRTPSASASIQPSQTSSGAAPSGTPSGKRSLPKWRRRFI